VILGAIAAFIIDKKFEWAALFAAAGAVLSFFGFIHGTSLGVANSAPVALGYLIVAGVCCALIRQSLFQPRRSLRMPSERTDRW
jgi:AGZA family xanthine/uracil permease-like MFS transporter